MQLRYLRFLEPLAYKYDSNWVVTNLNELGELPNLLNGLNLAFRSSANALDHLQNTLDRFGHSGSAATLMTVDFYRHPGH